MKIAICTPVYSDPSFWYVRSYGALIIHTLRERPDVELIPVHGRGSDVAWVRTEIAAEALRAGAESLLWIDADQTFPDWALIRLLSLSRSVVGCNYATRYEPSQPTARRRGPNGLEPVWTTPAEAQASQVDPVERMGLGFCLITAEVFSKIGPPWFDKVPNPEDPEGQLLSEDLSFFHRAQTAGFRLYLDHLTSWHVGHVGERIYSNADAVIHRAETKLRLANQKRRQG